MNQKQLANALIKILGLSLIAHGITPIFSTIQNLCQLMDTGYPIGSKMVVALFIDMLPIVIGIFLIVQSGWLVEKLFKEE